METNDEQQSSAENEELIQSDNAEQDSTQANDADTLENSETDEEKNARAIEEDATKRAAKEEKRQLGVQRRIDELTAARYQEKARADYAEAELQRLRQPAQPQQQASDEPQRDQFESYEDYLKASALYDARKVVREEFEQYQAKQNETTTLRQQEQSRQADHKRYIENSQKLEKEIPDFKDAIEDWDASKIPDSLVEMLLKLNEGPLVAYHMAKNPALENQFHGQPREMQGILLGQLIASLKSPPKVSNAPAPGKTVSTTKTTSNGDEPPADAEQYFAWAQRQQKAGKLR